MRRDAGRDLLHFGGPGDDGRPDGLQPTVALRRRRAVVSWCVPRHGRRAAVHLRGHQRHLCAGRLRHVQQPNPAARRVVHDVPRELGGRHGHSARAVELLLRVGRLPVYVLHGEGGDLLLVGGGGGAGHHWQPLQRAGGGVERVRRSLHGAADEPVQPGPDAGAGQAAGAAVQGHGLVPQARDAVPRLHQGRLRQHHPVARGAQRQPERAVPQNGRVLLPVLHGLRRVPRVDDGACQRGADRPRGAERVAQWRARVGQPLHHRCGPDVQQRGPSAELCHQQHVDAHRRRALQRAGAGHRRGRPSHGHRRPLLLGTAGVVVGRDGDAGRAGPQGRHLHRALQRDVQWLLPLQPVPAERHHPGQPLQPLRDPCGHERRAELGGGHGPERRHGGPAVHLPRLHARPVLQRAHAGAGSGGRRAARQPARPRHDQRDPRQPQRWRVYGRVLAHAQRRVPAVAAVDAADRQSPPGQSVPGGGVAQRAQRGQQPADGHWAEPRGRGQRGHVHGGVPRLIRQRSAGSAG
mmetsp:Transcript_60268/g.160426  ORF Transcript_60268/g.160426 Transcript_60268/m.160426 type:complete len:521 (-) Transcript_60268:1005-2567(-)